LGSENKKTEIKVPKQIEVIIESDKNEDNNNMDVEIEKKKKIPSKVVLKQTGVKQQNDSTKQPSISHFFY